MKYYQHHIRDFNNATRYLTRVERSLYRDLIEIYYDTELPLFSDMKQLEKISMARNDEEKEALKCVIKDFFVLEDDGYHNHRCDEVIGKYHSNSKAKSKAGKASAEKRKQESTRRKRNSTGVEQMVNEIQLTNNQELITNNHKPTDQDLCKEKKIIEELNLQSGKKFKPTPANLKFITARLKEGHSLDDIISVISMKVREWKNDPKMFKYLRPATLFNATKFNQYVGEIGVLVPVEVKDKPERKLSVAERATEARRRVEDEYANEHQTDLKFI